METRRQISGFVQMALAVIFFLVIEGQAGIAGEAVNELITFFFGGAGILLPLAFGISGLFLIFRKDGRLELRSSFGLTLCLVAILGLIHIQAPFAEIGARRSDLGGAIGFMVSFPLLAFTSVPVAYVSLVALLFVGLLVTFEQSPASLLRMLHRLMHPQAENDELQKRMRTKNGEKSLEDLVEEGMRKGLKEAVQSGKQKSSTNVSASAQDVDDAFNIVRPAFMDDPKGKNGKKGDHGVKNAQEPRKVEFMKKESDEEMEMQDTRFEDWEFPSFDCLDERKSEVMVDDKTLQAQARLIEEKLREFDIEVKVREAHPGPTVTQFALEPAEGVKLSRIANLKNDLALALAASSLRIEAPIPGKALVGIEMPNARRTTVHLREILESPEFVQSESPLSLPFGRDVSGKAVVEDLAKMPHLLIAGATGSGKSVCMNTFLLSLLYQNAPHELKFILIDPKRVELTSYDGIPHLLTPVITESEKALKALRWAVAEMGRRLARFSEHGARNLAEYNAKKPEEEHLPRIVIVIDELADLMMRQFRRDTELMITRIAQIARATGMHMIVATQRPSVDVITGIIKANIPTRIAFRTVSSIDSRTILDSVGAEDLLGNGDMLHLTAATPVPLRVQGILVSIGETEKVVNQVKIAAGGAITAEIKLGEENRGAGMPSGAPTQITEANAAPMDMDDDSPGVQTGVGDYSDMSVITDSGIDLDADDDGGDALTFEAIEIVRRTGKASASLLQRHLKVGYARAARILDILEEKGVIGPGEGAKARKVYVE